MPRKTNVPTVALRWSIERAGIEFGLASTTLRKSLAKNSALPDENGLYSTGQVVAALFGGLHFEKLRTQRARTRKLELENAITTGTVLDRAELMKGFAAIADAISSRIMASELSRMAKEDILRDIATIPLAMKNVAHRQTQLLRSNNGDEEDGSETDSIAHERSGIKAAHRRKSAAREKRV
jgi:hypothetical protein